MTPEPEPFERRDGGHCYLRARMLQGYVVIERWPMRASLSDIAQLGTWAVAQSRVLLGMSSLQAEVGAWCAATFKGQPLEGVFAHLWEELHEVFEHCCDEESREEVADAALIVMEVACKLGIALQRPSRFAEMFCEEFEAAMRVKFELCKQSVWRMNEQGVFHRDKR